MHEVINAITITMKSTLIICFTPISIWEICILLSKYANKDNKKNIASPLRAKKFKEDLKVIQNYTITG